MGPCLHTVGSHFSEQIYPKDGKQGPERAKQKVSSYNFTTLGRLRLKLAVHLRAHMSGWPSGLRRQTQEQSCLSLGLTEYSGPRMWAWVQIPPLTAQFFFLRPDDNAPDIHRWRCLLEALFAPSLKTLTGKLGSQGGAVKKAECWQRWDSNPRLRRDWCLKPAP